MPRSAGESWLVPAVTNPKRQAPQRISPAKVPARVTAADVRVAVRPVHVKEPLASTVREEATVVIGQLRRCCAGLSLVALLRAAAFLAAARPAGETRVAHWLTSASDLFALTLGLQILCWECALQKDVLGSIVTLLFAAALFDIAAIAALLSAQRVPRGEGATTAGIWEGAIVASVALQAVLLRCTWELYGVVRRLSSDGVSPVTVSPLELLCEEENVRLMDDCDGCTPWPQHDGAGAGQDKDGRRMRPLSDTNEDLEITFAADHDDLMMERVGYLTAPFRLALFPRLENSRELPIPAERRPAKVSM